MAQSTTPEINTPRLVLAPLAESDAPEMEGVLADLSLYEFTGGKAPTVDDLAAQYKFQIGGPPRDGEIWHNWILRLSGRGTAVGYVQATVIGDEADLAWVVGVAWQGQGYAREGATAMRAWLADAGAHRFVAYIHPDHTASQRVAATIGLSASGEMDEDGEEIWSSDPQ